MPSWIPLISGDWVGGWGVVLLLSGLSKTKFFPSASLYTDSDPIQVS